MSKSTSMNTRGSGALLPHRKVFMITEKSNGNDHERGRADAASAGRKRKMILIMDEKPQPEYPADVSNDNKQRSNGSKQKRTTNEPTTMSNMSNEACDTAPKLLFFANSVDDQLSQKIEEILPEILSRIKRKNGKTINGGHQTNEIQYDSNSNNDEYNQRQSQIEHQHEHEHEHQDQDQHRLLHEEFSDSSNSGHAATFNHHSINSNLMLLGAAAEAAKSTACQSKESIRPITLPPKKNHTKFQRQINNHNNNNNSNNQNDDEQIICAETPVIVSVHSMNKTINNPMSTVKTASYEQQQQRQHKHQHQQEFNNTDELNGNNQTRNHLNLHHYKHNESHEFYNSNDNNKTHDHNESAAATINSSEHDSIVVQHQNINLTGDFLFLMKMLPMLEKTPEPRKAQVKILIEKIMKQCVAEENNLH